MIRRENPIRATFALCITISYQVKSRETGRPFARLSGTIWKVMTHVTRIADAKEVENRMGDDIRIHSGTVPPEEWIQVAAPETA